MTDRDRPDGSFFNRQTRIVRRTTRLNLESGNTSSSLAIRLLLISVVASGIGGSAWAASRGKTPKDLADSFQERFSLAGTMECYGKPIPDKKPQIYVTDGFEGSNYDFAPVRLEPDASEKDIIAWAPFGQQVKAQAYYGVSYSGGSASSNGLGQVDCSEDPGNVYGTFYFVYKIQAFVDDGNGGWKLETRYNVYVPGNYLKKSDHSSPKVPA